MQRVHIFEEGLHVFFGVLADGDAGRGGVLDDAIVNVSEVHYLQDLETAGEQEAAEYVLEDKSTKIADMRIIVDRGAAAVDADFALVEGLEGLKAARKRVVEAYVCHFQRYGKRTIVAEGRVWGKGRNGNAIADRQYGWTGAGRLRRASRYESFVSSGSRSPQRALGTYGTFVPFSKRCAQLVYREK